MVVIPRHHSQYSALPVKSYALELFSEVRT
jgi:hypothetical protein